MDAAAEIGRNPVSKHHIQPEYGDEQADAGRDCRTRLARPNSQARTETGKYSFFLLQLTTSRIGNLTRLILLLLYVMHTYVHTNIHTYIHNGGDFGGTRKRCRKGSVGPVAANSNIVEINKEAGGGAEGTLSLSKNCTSRESVSPLSRLIRGFRNKYH